jgi:hypothetical protein
MVLSIDILSLFRAAGTNKRRSYSGVRSEEADSLFLLRPIELFNYSGSIRRRNPR